MSKNYFSLLTLVPILFSAPGTRMLAQENAPNIRVVVDMVQLNVAVTDNKGNYVTGLKPSDFVIVEDGIRKKIATFGEGNQAPKALTDIAQGVSDPKEVEPNTSGTLPEADPPTPSESSD